MSGDNGKVSFFSLNQTLDLSSLQDVLALTAHGHNGLSGGGGPGSARGCASDPASPRDYTCVERRKYPANKEDELRCTLENPNAEPRTTFWKCKKPQR